MWLDRIWHTHTHTHVVSSLGWQIVVTQCEYVESMTWTFCIFAWYLSKSAHASHAVWRINICVWNSASNLPCECPRQYNWDVSFLCLETAQRSSVLFVWMKVWLQWRLSVTLPSVWHSFRLFLQWPLGANRQTPLRNVEIMHVSGVHRTRCWPYIQKIAPLISVCVSLEKAMNCSTDLSWPGVNRKKTMNFLLRKPLRLRQSKRYVHETLHKASQPHSLTNRFYQISLADGILTLYRKNRTVRCKWWNDEMMITNCFPNTSLWNSTERRLITCTGDRSWLNCIISNQLRVIWEKRRCNFENDNSETHTSFHFAHANFVSIVDARTKFGSRTVLGSKTCFTKFHVNQSKYVWSVYRTAVGCE